MTRCCQAHGECVKKVVSMLVRLKLLGQKVSVSNTPTGRWSVRWENSHRRVPGTRLHYREF